jgi:MFS superfamily sulfate permease-like transporter
MRTSVAILIAVVLGCLFLVQKQRERLAAVAKTEEKVAEKKAVTPRPVSEHNWAKHALDTTRKVTDKVAAQRKEDGVRK